MKEKIYIKSEIEYRAILKRIDVLLEMVTDETPDNDVNSIELDILSNLVEDYELVYYPINKPSFTDVFRLRITENALTQKQVATILKISPSRVSELLTGKSEPTITVARNICKEFDIDANILLGV